MLDSSIISYDSYNSQIVLLVYQAELDALKKEVEPDGNGTIDFPELERVLNQYVRNSENAF